MKNGFFTKRVALYMNRVLHGILLIVLVNGGEVLAQDNLFDSNGTSFDKLDFNYLRTYTDKEMEDIVDSVYQSLDIRDTLDMLAVVKELEAGHLFQSGFMDSIMKSTNWNNTLRKLDWSYFMKDIDWDVIVSQLCARSDSLSFMTTNNNLHYDTLKMGEQKDSHLFPCMKDSIGHLMKMIDLGCMMKKLGSGLNIEEAQSAKAMCDIMECFDVRGFFESMDFNCLFQSIDINPLMRGLSLGSIFGQPDSTKSASSGPTSNSTIGGHPILQQLKNDSLLAYFRSNPTDLFDSDEIKTLYGELSDDVLRSGWIQNFASNRSYMRSTLRLFGPVYKEVFGDTRASRVFLVYSVLSEDLNNNLLEFKFDSACYHISILKDIMLLSYRDDLFNSLVTDEINLHAVIGGHFEMLNLVTMYHNLGFAKMGLGAFEDAISEFSTASSLIESMLSVLRAPFDPGDYLNLTYTSVVRDSMVNKWGLTEDIIEDSGSQIMSGRDPSFISAQVEKGEFDEAIASYVLLKDLLLIRGAKVDITSDMYRPNLEMSKVINFRVLRALYWRMEDLIKKSSFGHEIRYAQYLEARNVLLRFELEQQQVLQYHELGNVYVFMGNHEKSMEYMTKAWELIKGLTNLDYALALRMGGGVYDQGHIGRFKAHAVIAGSKGSLYVFRGEYKRAYDFLNNAIDYIEGIAERELQMSVDSMFLFDFELDLFEVYSSRGAIAGVIGKLDEALLDLRKCQEIAERGQYPMHRYYASSELGDYYVQVNQVDSALYYYDQTIEVAKETNFTIGLASAYLRKGRLYQSSGQIEKALALYADCEEISESLSLHNSQVALNTLRGLIFKESDNFTRALEYFQKAIDITEDNFLSNVNGQASRQIAVKLGFSAYTGAFESALELQQVGQAFQVIQQSKSRTLVELLSSVAHSINLIPQELVAERNAISYQLGQNQERLIRTAATTILDSLREVQHGLLRKLETVNSSIQDSLTVFSGGTGSDLKIETIQNEMKSGQAFIEYFIGESLYAILIKKNKTHVFNLGSKVEFLKIIERLKLLEQRVERSYKSILDQKYCEKEYWNPNGEFSHALRYSYNTLIGPIVESGLLEYVDHILIAPDGDLYHLPFEMFISEGSGDTWESYHYLIDDYNISYYQSAAVFHQNHLGPLDTPPDQPTKFMLGVVVSDFKDYPNLHNLRIPEITQLEEIDKGSIDILKDEGATATAFDSLASQGYEIIYISTHGVVDPIPELSYLALSDGPLSLFNILDLQLPCRTIILSACRTGQGTFQRGGGLMGFTRALMYAGARSVVISLWSVNEAVTADIFSPYLQEVSTGKDQLTLLHHQKLALKKADKPVQLYADEQSPYVSTAHPFFWAPFVYFGATD